MCDPIVDSSISVETRQFTEEVVKKYLQAKDSFKEYPLRHYSQINVPFNDGNVTGMLGKLGIPIKNTVATVLGGYTGQFANCLRRIGMQVIFTDPLAEWVSEASKLGFESYKYDAQEIPKKILRQTELFATFECYYALAVSSETYYSTLRFLSSKHGILFAESKYTRDELTKDGPKRQMKASFSPFSKIYSVSCNFKSKGDLPIVPFFSNRHRKRED